MRSLYRGCTVILLILLATPCFAGEVYRTPIGQYDEDGKTWNHPIIGDRLLGYCTTWSRLAIIDRNTWVVSCAEGYDPNRDVTDTINRTAINADARITRATDSYR